MELGFQIMASPNERKSRNMKRFWPVPLVLLLAGCVQDSDVVQAGTFLWNSFDKSAEKIPRERAAAVPYATMGMELGSSAQALLILGTITRDELDWFAGEQVFVRTRNGRVIRTAGLPYDLGGLRDLSTNSTPRGSQLAQHLSSSRWIFPIWVFLAPRRNVR
jgi:hypothetical protein